MADGAAADLGNYFGQGLSLCSSALAEVVGWRDAALVWAGTAGAVSLTVGVVVPRALHAARVRRAALAGEEGKARAGPAARGLRLGVLRQLWRTPALPTLVAASAVTMVGRFALLAWLPTFYQQVHALSPSSYGPTVGLLIAAGGGIASACGGWLVSAMGRRQLGWARVHVLALSQLLPLPFWLGALLSSESDASYACLFFAILLGDAYLPVSAATVLSLAPAEARARASTVLLTSNTFAGGCGPVLVGALVNGGTALPTALCGITGATFVLSGVLFYFAGRGGRISGDLNAGLMDDARAALVPSSDELCPAPAILDAEGDTALLEA